MKLWFYATQVKQWIRPTTILLVTTFLAEMQQAINILFVACLRLIALLVWSVDRSYLQSTARSGCLFLLLPGCFNLVNFTSKSLISLTDEQSSQHRHRVSSTTLKLDPCGRKPTH